MGSSAFEIILLPVLWGTFWGIVAGATYLAVMNAVKALVDWLDRKARSIKAAYQADHITPRRTYQPAVRNGLGRGAHG
jgi:hypothetical protein